LIFSEQREDTICLWNQESRKNFSVTLKKCFVTLRVSLKNH